MAQFGTTFLPSDQASIENAGRGASSASDHARRLQEAIKLLQLRLPTVRGGPALPQPDSINQQNFQKPDVDPFAPRGGFGPPPMQKPDVPTGVNAPRTLFGPNPGDVTYGDPRGGLTPPPAVNMDVFNAIRAMAGQVPQTPPPPPLWGDPRPPMMASQAMGLPGGQVDSSPRFLPPNPTRPNPRPIVSHPPGGKLPPPLKPPARKVVSHPPGGPLPLDRPKTPPGPKLMPPRKVKSHY